MGRQVVNPQTPQEDMLTPVARSGHPSLAGANPHGHPRPLGSNSGISHHRRLGRSRTSRQKPSFVFEALSVCSRKNGRLRA